MKRLARAAELAGVFGGIALGTVSVCGMIPNEWGLLSWMISIVSAIRVFSARRSPADGKPRSIVLRVVLASVVVFCFVFLITMSVALAANPGPIAFNDKVVAAIFATIGTVGAAISIKLT